MSNKKSYPLRISPAVIEAMQRWADDDLRSLNGQIEFVLRESLRRAGRLKTTTAASVDDSLGLAANGEAPLDVSAE